ncbi:MAG: tRNA uridine-5-carboxymethylaminomethyl(34) synthesis GTPase MnmE [Crocinitomicaceae bacterium]|nr:tRNA uridine-5-carboxymethylaminomethyl(34) synthesis GTPase MnmE [Crocinitomicaceae bacterium]|tara:strand:- start:5463 stop:6851 length:1389 start_codon:yes stop_codon:yes gene_type:complete
MQTFTDDTICALATGSGPAAISVIRLSGPEAVTICNRVFKGKDLTQVSSHTIHFGTIRNDDNSILDEVLVSVFLNPNSYTGEDVIEISCHGSPFIRQEVINLLMTKGARMAKPGEFTLRAFLNQKLDLSQAEAVADLINADSEASHRLAMQQMRGGFSNEIGKLRQQLIDFASLIELELDFSEEDVEFADRDALNRLLLKLHQLTYDLIRSFKVGNVMKNGVPVVIAGKPNAGKSTLLNQLLKDERAIVSDIAGTTRDVIEDEMVLDGIVFRFFDTAGIRETQDTVEAIGVQKTLEKIHAAAIVIYLFDVNDMEPDELQTIVTDLQQQTDQNNAQLLVVANKIDGHSTEELQQRYPFIENPVFIAAKSGTGITELEKRLTDFVNTSAVGNEDVVVTNSRHYEALVNANEALLRGHQGLENGITGDFIAMDIRQALHYLGEITGEITNDDLLGNIFANFCIGK